MMPNTKAWAPWWGDGVYTLLFLSLWDSYGRRSAASETLEEPRMSLRSVQSW